MGLVRVIGASIGGVLKEQWKEYFRCGEMDMNTLMVRAHKVITKGSSNDDPSDSIVTNGSLLIVADGQCVIVVSQGKVLDWSAEPGEHYFKDRERAGGAAGLMRQIGSRIAYGGVQAATDQVYYVNMKECMANSFHTPEPVPVQLEDEKSGLSLDASVTLGGTFSYRIKDPLAFYKTLTENVEGIYTRDRLTAQVKSDLLTAVGPALGRLTADGYRPSDIPAQVPALCDALREIMNDSGCWTAVHGLEISNVSLSTLIVNGFSYIQEMQHAAVFAEEEDAEVEWICSCGQRNTGKFCTECGKAKSDL